MKAKRSVILLAMMMVAGSLGAIGFSAGGTSGRTGDNDNDFSLANALTSGVQASGEVNFSDDPSDFYKIDLVAGKCMKIVLSYSCSTSPINFRVYDQSQTELLVISTGNTTRGDTILASTNGTHYVKVETRSSGQSYLLTVTVGDPATLVAGTQVAGMLSFTGVERSDWYRIWLNGNVSGKSEGVYVNMTEELQTTNCNLFLWDIDVGLLNPYNLSRTVSPRETVSCLASFTGWYYLLANTWAGSGGYTLDVTKFQGNSDGNNDFANATPVKHNAVVAGTLDQGWDKYDWFRYHVLAGDTFQVRASRSAGQDLFNLSIYDSGRRLLVGDLNVVAGAITNSITLNQAAAASDRDYYVAIYSYAAIRNNQYSDETGKESYSLAFTSTNHWPGALSSFQDIFLNEDEKAAVEVASHFQDIDGDALIFNVTGNANIAPFYNTSSMMLELTPAANWAGKETLTVTADDGFGGKTSLTINLTVAAVNDVPFVKKKLSDLKMLQGGLDTSVDLSRVFYDNDIPWGDRLNYSVENNGTLRVAIAADGKVTITDPIEFYGQVSMQFIATDGEGASAVAPCNVTVQHVNQPPRVKSPPGNISLDEDTTATLDMSGVFYDLDGDPITLLASGQNKITVIIDPNTYIVSFKPAPNLSGFYEDITITAQDDKGFGENFVVVRVTVVVVNDPPVIKSYSPTGEVTLTEGDSGQDFSVTATTVETWDKFNYTWYLDERDLLWNEDTYPLKFDYTSAGKHTLKVVVDDGEGTVSRSWTITVLNKNRDPTEVKITSPKTGEEYRQAAEIEFSGSARDPDGDVLTYTWLEGRTELSTEKSFSTSSLKPGLHKITLEVSDGTATVSKQVSITVTANTKPSIILILPATGQTFTTGKQIDFSVSARDTEGDSLKYAWVDKTDNGRLLGNTSAFSTSGLKEGTHQIELSIYDGFSYTNQTLMVEVVAPKAAGLGGNMMLYLAAVVAVIGVAGGLAFLAMRRKKPGAPGPETQVAPPGPAAAPAETYAPAPQEDGATAPAAPYDTGSDQQPSGEPAPSDAGAYQPPAGPQYDESQYSAESGISDEQPGVSGQQPAWASAPARPPMPGGTPEVEAPPSEPAPPEPAPAEPSATEPAPTEPGPAGAVPEAEKKD